MSIQSQLIDATQYELIQKSPNVYEWQERGESLGVEIRVSTVSGTTLISVHNQKNDGYIMLTLSEIERDLRVAIDIMQSGESYDQEQWPFAELSAVLNACNLDYVICGLDKGISIGIARGSWIDKTDYGYLLWNPNGVEYAAGSIDGLKKAYRTLTSTADQIVSAEMSRNIEKIAKSGK
jgi:hypothetical protein